MVKLDIPIYGQQIFYYCVPTCVKMVLEYVRKKYRVKIPRFSIKKIARIIETRREGTAPKDVEKMNEALRKAVPSVEFEAKLLSRIQEIMEELNEERPVIVWINCVEPPDTVWHAVVITGFDPDTNMIFYNDPEGGVEKKEEVGVFNKKWGIEARLIKVLIGRRKQRLIKEWTRETRKEMSEA